MITLANKSHWEFFAKGNANLVYKYTGPATDDGVLNNQTLLRVRQNNQDFDTTQVYEFTEKVRKDIPELVPMILVRVCFEIDEALNDGYGLLMPNIIPKDMRVVSKGPYFTLRMDASSYILELKPKWLVKTKLGCRNCAHQKFKHGQEAEFCSLSLLDADTIPSAVDLIACGSEVTKPLCDYFMKDVSIVKRLYRAQKPLELETLKNESDVTDDICYQMSLRDATVFIELKKQSKEAEFTAEAIVTDVDPKSPKKWEHWRTTERRLISSFY